MELGPFPRTLRSLFISAFLALSLAAGSPPVSADAISHEIVPGPRQITAEEKSLSADAQGGGEHGIVLAKESERDDASGGGSRLTVRFRAKIFEGRRLADLQVPHPAGSILLKWWAWTLLPDGTVKELPKEDLRQQVLAMPGGEEISVLTGRLPGVVPDCVIEYGYVMGTAGPHWRHRVELQGSWPIREFRYHWLPYRGRVASVRISRAEGLSIDLKNDSRSILVTGKNLPAVEEEPFMPPLKEVRASATLYYQTASRPSENFWTWAARKVTQQAAIFARDKPMKAALAGMDLSAGDDPKARLRAVHGWLATHVQVTGMSSFEKAEEARGDKEPELFAEDVLESRRATALQMNYLFMGFARLLGAEANLVMATDRTDRLFDPALLTTDQFDAYLVAVHFPGDPSDQFSFVDSVVGLPFGEIPWWIAGANGFLADPKGGSVVMLRPSNPVKNLSESRTSLSLNLDEGTADVHWSRTDAGQAGLLDRLRLRFMRPENRRKKLEELCGAGASFEVIRAEAPGLEDLNSPLRLVCEGRKSGAGFSQMGNRRLCRFDGAWEEPVPELTAATRLHPVVFPFPRIDRNVIDIATPPGYAAAAPPAVAPIDSLYGHYALFISPTPTGYHVERVFSLTSGEVPVSGYNRLRRFLSEVRQADRTEVEFRKAE